MFRPDPEFASPKSVREIAGAVCDKFSIPTFKREMDWMREDIASLEEEARDNEKRIANIELEIPLLQTELLTKQRDLAETRLRIHEKKAKLAEMEGRQGVRP